MTDKLEKQFFDTFGIEKRKTNKIYIPSTSECIAYDLEYPQITDRILLELICIVLNTFQTFEVYRIMEIDSLKEKILKLSMLAKDDVYSEVCTLFEDR